MKIIFSIKSILAKLTSSLGIPEATIKYRSGKQFLILMYHRILPADQRKPWIQPGMYVEPETFGMHIRYLKQHFQIIPLSEKFPYNQDYEKSHSLRPVCLLTFDDGWLDFYKYAYPVLKQNQVPATVFLPTGYIGTGDLFWTDELARYLTSTTLQREPVTFGNKACSPLLKEIMELEGTFEGRLETAIAILKNRRDSDIVEVTRWIKESIYNGTDIEDERVFLNWEEVREMGRSGFVTFGSHTHTHRILVHLEEEEVVEELVRSKEILIKEGAVDPSFIPFCYPNGNWNQRIAAMVRKAGYDVAVSTGTGWNDGNVSPFELKRVAIHQDMTKSREMFECRIAEIM